MICFFSHWPGLFTENKIYIIPSPRYIFTKNKGKKNEQRVYCYDTKEYESVRDKYKGWELRYIKGLGSLRPNEYSDVLVSEEKWIQVEIDDSKCFDIMFSSDVNARRTIMGI